MSGMNNDFYNTERPVEPTEEDCCHNDCANCVFDIYRKQLENDNSGVKVKNKSERNEFLSQIRFQPFLLVKKTIMCNHIILLKFQPKVDDKNDGCIRYISGILPYEPGQHLMLCCRRGQEDYSSSSSPGKNISRPYSIISLAKEELNCCFEVVVKIYEQGEMSQMIKHLELGNTTFWRGPYGSYRYIPNLYKHIFMLCMGTGIAPMYPIIKTIVTNENDFTFISLLYGIKHVIDIILRNELCSLASFWNFKFTYFLSNENSPPNQRHCEKFVRGRMTADIIKAELLGKEQSSFILICGSEEFNNDLRNYVVNCGVQDKNIYIL